MPGCVPASRIAESGGDVSELERGLDSSQIVLAPTLAVQQGRTNPSVRYVCIGCDEYALNLIHLLI